MCAYHHHNHNHLKFLPFKQLISQIYTNTKDYVTSHVNPAVESARAYVEPAVKTAKDIVEPVVENVKTKVGTGQNSEQYKLNRIITTVSN